MFAETSVSNPYAASSGGRPLWSEPLRVAAHRALCKSLSRMFLSLGSPRCLTHLGPIVPGATMPGGARVPGTSLELDPVQAAFNLTLLLHWREFEPESASVPGSGEPLGSDHLGGILAVADWLARRALMQGRPPLRMRAVLEHLLVAQDLERSLLGVVEARIRMRIATVGVVTALLGGTQREVGEALCRGACRGASGWDDISQGELPAIALADGVSRGVQCALRARRALPGIAPLTAAEESPGFELEAALDVDGELAAAVGLRFPPKQAKTILAMFARPLELETRPVNEFVAVLVSN